VLLVDILFILQEKQTRCLMSLVLNSLLRLATTVQRRRRLTCTGMQTFNIVSYWHSSETRRTSARLLYTTVVRLVGSARNTRKKLVSSLTCVTLLDFFCFVFT